MRWWGSQFSSRLDEFDREFISRLESLGRSPSGAVRATLPKHETACALQNRNKLFQGRHRADTGAA